jgi:hypothetical protein
VCFQFWHDVFQSSIQQSNQSLRPDLGKRALLLSFLR